MADEKAVSAVPEKVIRQRRDALSIRRGYIGLLLRVVVISLAVWVLMSFVFLVCQTDGMSMYPAIKDGDLVFSYRLHREYEKNDAVVFEIDGQKRVGRILALEGDTVIIREGGILYVNGTVQQGEIMYPTYPKKGVTYPFVVPEGECFILCDYRTRCEDSRDFGSVSMDDVKGKVITILRRQNV